MLDMTPLGWLGHKTSSQTKTSAWINCVNADQMLQNDSVRVFMVCHSSSIILDTSTSHEMDLFKFYDNYGKVKGE